MSDKCPQNFVQVVEQMSVSDKCPCRTNVRLPFYCTTKAESAVKKRSIYNLRKLNYIINTLYHGL